jgi:hypothetical protein
MTRLYHKDLEDLIDEMKKQNENQEKDAVI